VAHRETHVLAELDLTALNETLHAARRHLLEQRGAEGYWEGELSSSALSTATAAAALATVDKDSHRALIEGGLNWLAEHANADGGWGDTVLSNSNISTTVLCWSAFAAADRCGGPYRDVLAGAESWLIAQAGSLAPERIAAALSARYGKDRTFLAPILTMCAISGRLGPGRRGWQWVVPLPFELAACPHRWFKWLGLGVVSYALPALIAVGQARFRHCPPRNPLRRALRGLARNRTLKVLEGIQPSSGGFLEAAPLTSFVVMSLASAGLRDHGVVSRGVDFLVGSVRADGSWPIDTNLSTWATTLSVNALAAGGDLGEGLSPGERSQIRGWLLGRQYRREHPYTHAAPGGWAWTHLPGGVPDADDTAGALLALHNLGTGGGDARAAGWADERVAEAARLGAAWLLGLQNRDGGIPTFCRGWGKLPFDRGSPDVTAHALRALDVWLDDLGEYPGDVAAAPRGRGFPGRRQSPRCCMEAATRRGIAFLQAKERGDGSWAAIWFGNQWCAAEENLTYGTAKVLLALQHLEARWGSAVAGMARRGRGWLVSAQNGDGGWGGGPGSPSSIEETALAVDALAAGLAPGRPSPGPLPAGQAPAPPWAEVESALAGGVNWLVRHTQRGTRFDPSPIGFYFASLWYFERLYPVIFTVSALSRTRAAVGPDEGARGPLSSGDTIQWP